MKLAIENTIPNELPMRNDLIREWSSMRCIMSPIFFVSKKFKGILISFIRKSDNKDIPMREFTCSKIHPRMYSVLRRAMKNVNWAIRITVIIPIFRPFIPKSTIACVRNGNASCKRLLTAIMTSNWTIWDL